MSSNESLDLWAKYLDGQISLQDVCVNCGTIFGKHRSGDGACPEKCYSETSSYMDQRLTFNRKEIGRQILSQLAAYTGDNIWEEIIYHLPGFDGAATDAINAINAPEDHDVFVAGGVTYRHNPISGWTAQERNRKCVGT